MTDQLQILRVVRTHPSGITATEIVHQIYPGVEDHQIRIRRSRIDKQLRSLARWNLVVVTKRGRENVWKATEGQDNAE
ncbi:hypothetical protein TALC_00355 [Thermoplasmatales archaeon BRNA1]|nr:hypothetical protein TALC_00355 [Thermoplasmatales archaeon BRNA1]